MAEQASRDGEGFDIEAEANKLQEAMLHAAISNIDPTDHKRIQERHHWLICEALRKAARSERLASRDAAQIAFDQQSAANTPNARMR